MTTQPLNHAIIIGGSITGLLTAQVLANHAAQVTIIEKDVISASSTGSASSEIVQRKGAPQASQFHVMQQGGVNLIQKLFPDLDIDWEKNGIAGTDIGSGARAYFGGEWLPKVHVGVNLHWCDRLRFESALRKRLLQRSNVTLRDGTKVKALLHSAGRVTGVALQGEEPLSADLVVDASGRGSRLPQWLKALGYDAPETSTMRVDLADVTAVFQLPDHIQPEWDGIAITPVHGVNNRIGAAYRMPNNQLRVLLAGWFGVHPTTDEAEFHAFAQQLPQPDLYDILRHATLIEPIRKHKLPSNQWRHYEKMSDFPEGLIVLGDAVCSFNPTYGQGMTIAASHVIALETELAHKHIRSRRFQKVAAKISAEGWQNATGQDMRFPEAEGERTRGWRVMQWYFDQLMATAHHNPEVAKRFYLMMSLTKSPAIIFAPTVLWAIFKHRWQGRFGRKNKATPQILPYVHLKL